MGVASGVQWVHLHAPAMSGIKIVGEFTGKICKCTPAHQVQPRSEEESIFRTFFAMQERFRASVSSFRPSFEGVD